MADLEKIVLLETIINENSRQKYNTFTKEQKRYYENILREYLVEVDDISNKRVVFVNNFLKLANQTLNEFSSSTLENNIEKLFEFNVLGINKNRNEREHLKNKGITLLEDYVLTIYAFNTAKVAFKKTGNIIYGQKGYDFAIDSAETSFEVNRGHSAYAYTAAGDLAKSVFEYLERYRKVCGIFYDSDNKPMDKIEWIDKWHDSELIAGNIKRNLGKDYGCCFSLAGEASHKKYLITKNSFFAEKAIEEYFIFLKSQEHNPDNPMITIVSDKIIYLKDRAGL